MLKKVIRLKNVGRFADCKPAGDVTFRKVTLIYGGNGQGKTTLCAVLRSLAANDGRYIAERKTRGQAEAPQAEILTDNGNAKFKDGAWESHYPLIAIYDSEFVHENIYSGDMVDHQHKRKLYRVMVGEVGVELASQIDALDELSRESAKELSIKRAAVEDLAPTGMKATEFAKLKDDPNLDKSIKAKRGEVEALKRANEIEKKAAFSQIELLVFPDNFNEVLKATMPGADPTIEHSVRDHLANHTNDLDERWIATGYAKSKDEVCPYCAQSTADIQLVNSYALLFGEQFEKLRQDTEKIKQELNQRLSPQAIIRSDRTKDNEILFQFWSQFADIQLAPLEFKENVEHELSEVYAKAIELVNEKTSSPLKVVGSEDEVAGLVRRVEVVADKIRLYNDTIEQTNKTVAQRKKSADTGNLSEEQLTLNRLEAAKLRHSTEGIKAVGEFEDAQLRKKEIDREKRQKRRKLDEYSEATFASYGQRINELLENFGADFRISNIVPKFAGGHPSSNYSILINDEAIGVGDAKTPRGEPAFRSTLSAGDKSSLALAFFVAQLEKQPNLADLTVVFDDPFSSQDRSRRKYTQQLICRKASDVKQVVVVSHDPDFLLALSEGMHGQTLKVLQVARTGKNGATIAECDLNKETQDTYLKDISALKEFVDTGQGDLLGVARTMRPVLEVRLRFMLPQHFGSNEWLGDMIRRIRESTPPSPLTEQKASLDDIEDINDYSKDFHHDQPHAIDAPELKTYVKRTLRFVGSA